ncbi:MAG: hypothetical protein HOM21_03240 [Halobacteriovoraceae bacterium]|nr:hypothetical protein [Halobacteriovoraceae bacterium]
MIIFTLLFSHGLLAQEAEGGGTSSEILDDTFKDLSIVGGCAVGGAILGLSTLSFVEHPGDHLKNIYVGLSIGTIIGVGIVAFSQATKSKGSYDDASASLWKPAKEFSTVRRSSWHRDNHQRVTRRPENLPGQFNYNFSF